MEPAHPALQTEEPSAATSHNPLIAENTWETLTNVNDVLATVQELTFMPLAGELSLGSSSTSGLYLILACARNALAYEVEKMPGKR